MNNQPFPGLNYVRVGKAKLIATLRTNLNAHRATFDEAMDGYRTKAVELLEAHIDRIKANAPEQVNVHLPMPENHSEDYEQAIAMLEWSQDDEVWLTADEFDQYVRDNWFWKPSFLATATTYGAGK